MDIVTVVCVGLGLELVLCLCLSHKLELCLKFTKCIFFRSDLDNNFGKLVLGIELVVEEYSPSLLRPED